MSGLPRDEDGIITDASFGDAFMVQIEYTTDFDGRVIDPDQEDYVRTFHGPFDTEAEAKEWLEAYPDFDEMHDMTVIVLNKVRP